MINSKIRVLAGLSGVTVTILGVLFPAVVMANGGNLEERPSPRTTPEESEEQETRLQPRDQIIAPGVRWFQRYVSLGSDRFPVVALEIDPRNPNVSLRPIWGEPPTMTGTEPLVTMGRRWRVLAAINGGFFNRNNRLPLGAIRRDNQWYSGPILNRGAIAWDDQGNIKIDRLYLREVLTTSDYQRHFIQHLNSGYIQAGISRYTPQWGTHYIPLTDNETVVVVRGNTITRHFNAPKANESSYAIPQDGYILTIRGNSISPQQLAVGSKVELTTDTVPSDFANYPYIMGAGPLLLQNGRLVLDGGAEKFSNAFINQSASRSVIGTTRNGAIIMAAIHNRIDGRGPKLTEVAQLMQRLGVVNALNLDGGSSTSLYLNNTLIDRPSNTAARVHNGIGIFIGE